MAEGKVNNREQGMPKLVMVCGPMDWTQEMFDEHYPPLLEVFINDNCEFIMGGAEGVDRMAQVYLSQIPGAKVTVYDRRKENGVVCRGVLHVAGFESYEKRDKFMLDKADRVVGRLDQYGGACTSTGYSLLTMALGTTDLAKKAQDCIKTHTVPYNSDSRKLSRDTNWRHFYANRGRYVGAAIGLLALTFAIGVTTGMWWSATVIPRAPSFPYTGEISNTGRIMVS